MPGSTLSGDQQAGLELASSSPLFFKCPTVPTWSASICNSSLVFILQGRYYPHFKDEDPKAERHKVKYSISYSCVKSTPGVKLKSVWACGLSSSSFNIQRLLSTEFLEPGIQELPVVDYQDWKSPGVLWLQILGFWKIVIAHNPVWNIMLSVWGCPFLSKWLSLDDESSGPGIETSSPEDSKTHQSKAVVKAVPLEKTIQLSPSKVLINMFLFCKRMGHPFSLFWSVRYFIFCCYCIRCWKIEWVNSFKARNQTVPCKYFLVSFITVLEFLVILEWLSIW